MTAATTSGLSVSEFGFVSELVRREAAIVLEPGKEYLVEARLTPLARAAGLPSVSEYVRHAHRSGTAAQRWAIVEALTTNETSWFRDAGVFEGLRTQLLPQLQRERSAHAPLRFWSAAASTGQEAYSLAMMLVDTLETGRRYQILGTDISREVLDRARAGRYTQLEMNRGLPARHLVRFFERSGAGWQVGAQLRKDVTFRELNLAVPFVGLPTFDVILLRNVLIYFDLPTKQAILRRVRQVLAADGWLILGTAETTRGIDDQFQVARLGALNAYRPATAAATPLRKV
jgi:chemotaxis protein methyltransferase CheR